MAFIRCRECNKKISDQAGSCPKCGCPVSCRPRKTNQQGKEHYCPYCFQKTPAESQCKHCKKQIDTSRVEADYVGMMPRTTWGKPNIKANTPNKPTTEPNKTAKKPKIPWFAVGMVANQLRDAKVKADNNERERKTQNSIMEAALKEMKKK